MFHYSPNVGYAFDTLMATLVEMATRLLEENGQLHISFKTLEGIDDKKFLSESAELMEFDISSKQESDYKRLAEYIRKNNIDVVFGFDLPVRKPFYRHIRKAGVKKLVSYLGAPMSDINKGIVLRLKQLEVLLTPSRPDHYIFESRAMARTGYEGRGIPKKETSVVHLGVDTEKYMPSEIADYYAHEIFNIPCDRNIVYFSGHMEPRKGVSTLIQAAKCLYEKHDRRDYHLLIFGNKNGQEGPYLKQIEGHGCREHVTFGGYRSDLDKILRSVYVGVIASTGWDSFTMSSLEIASSGIPLIVSNLQGLSETVDHNETGFIFTPGNHLELSARIIELLDNPDIRMRMGRNARMRILNGYTKEQQIEQLVLVMRKVIETMSS